MRRLVLLLALSSTSCVTPASVERAHFTVVSAVGVPPSYEIANPRVSGEACGSGSGAYEPLVQLAVEDALRQAPGADGLASAEITFERQFASVCYRVTGAALKLTR